MIWIVRSLKANYMKNNLKELGIFNLAKEKINNSIYLFYLKAEGVVNLFCADFEYIIITGDWNLRET